MFGLSGFILFLGLALIVTKIPVVGKYFRLVHTLIHEVGHVLMSLITSGKVYHVHLFSDMSGVATTSSKGWMSRVLTSMAGYPFAALSGLVMLWLIGSGLAHWVLYGLTALLVVSMLFWVRNLFGLFWSLAFLTLMVLLYAFGTAMWIHYFVLFITAIVVVESVWTTIIVLILSIKDPQNSGDSYNLSKSTRLPAVIWSIGFVVFSLYVFSLGINYWI